MTYFAIVSCCKHAATDPIQSIFLFLVQGDMETIINNNKNKRPFFHVLTIFFVGRYIVLVEFDLNLFFNTYSTFIVHIHNIFYIRIYINAHIHIHSTIEKINNRKTFFL